jgi:hypothetical protein
MYREYNSIIENKIYILVNLLKGRKAIKSRWVAKGFLQREGIDFDQIWVSVVSLMGVRALIAWATANGWFIRQSDVKTAFLNGEIEEEVYIE